MVVSMITWNGHISLTAVRVAGEAPKRSTITDIIWLEKIFVSTSFVHFFFHHRTSVDDLIDLISSDRHHWSIKPVDNLWRKVYGKVPGPVHLRVEGLNLTIHIKMLNSPSNIGLKVSGVGSWCSMPIVWWSFKESLFLILTMYNKIRKIYKIFLHIIVI